MNAVTPTGEKAALLPQQLSSQLTSLCHKSLLTGAHNHHSEKLFPSVTIPVKYTDSLNYMLSFVPKAPPMHVGNNCSSEARDHVIEPEQHSRVENKPPRHLQEPGDRGGDGHHLLPGEPLATLCLEPQTHVSEAPGQHRHAQLVFSRGYKPSGWPTAPGTCTPKFLPASSVTRGTEHLLSAGAGPGGAETLPKVSGGQRQPGLSAALRWCGRN